MGDRENKQLLLVDLCARLLYGVIVHLKYDKNTSITRELGIGSLHDIMVNNAEGRPYLRPMSTMTKEECLEYSKACELDTEILSNHPMDGTTPFPVLYHSQDYLNSIHVDYRGLIHMGLAIEVTEENNPYEKINL